MLKLKPPIILKPDRIFSSRSDVFCFPSLVKVFLMLLLMMMLVLDDSIAEDGYRLWLRYDAISDPNLLDDYRSRIKVLSVLESSKTLSIAKNELKVGLTGLLDTCISEENSICQNGFILAGTIHSSPVLACPTIIEKLKLSGKEGYVILTTVINEKVGIVIAANDDIGVLYGVFHLLRLIQTHREIHHLSVVSAPKIKLRILDHWDNLDRTVERGYAGFSIWDWSKLPDYISPRYYDYARVNASIGINGTVLTNVNANALVLTPRYLNKVRALADIFRPYGIKIYLTARFNAPMKIGGLGTADPLNEKVSQWWREKVDEIYRFIPDFGGFLVKANSEGQPGPQDYGRTPSDGANMLADALAPHRGIVMWRAFVYNDKASEDRAKQAYKEFKPLDGTFRNNVVIQVKNGPIDFQPREPFHPLFGAMPETHLMAEFQITQEYLGFATHLVYLASLYKECLDSETYAQGEGSTVARVIDGSLYGHNISGMAGVSNIGTDRNWTGHTFGQANWYAFGRLAWNHQLTAKKICEEWIRMTFSNDDEVIKTVASMMLASREITVSYMTPLGLHHLMGWSHHYGPAPWIKNKSRADWTSVYYHKADSFGIGFDRTISGSNAVSQYNAPLDTKFGFVDTCPDKYLLWFHHLRWDYIMRSGRTLWDELCYKYYRGADSVKWLEQEWLKIKDKIDHERFERVRMLLKIQEKEAIWWRNACVLYFQTFSAKQIPADLERPEKSLDYYEGLSFPYAPGIRPRW